MKPKRWQQIEELYHAALKYAPDERAAFLTEACAGDEQVRREVESLLGYDQKSPSFIETPPDTLAAEMLKVKQQSVSLIGRGLAHYRIRSLLGSGGMGQVYLAEDTKLGRKIAVKVLPRFFTTHRDRVLRFEREAKAASALNHPNILTIHEIRHFEGLHFIVTEFVDGETLRKRIDKGRLDVADAIALVVQVVGALVSAHEAGIIHRDIKPENIMVRPDGLVKVLDFGLAKLTDQSDKPDSEVGSLHPTAAAMLSTDPGLVLGTVNYMSPEQARGLKLDHRTDIFSLGVMLYELLTGHRPFEGETGSDVLAAILKSDPLPVSQLNSSVPPQLEQIVSRMLDKNPDSRYSSTAELRAELKSLQRRLEPSDEGTRTKTPTPGALPLEPQQTIVGREAELNKLDGLLDRAIIGLGRVVFIVGNPGIGKTALCELFLRRARAKAGDLIFAKGRCLEQYGTGEAYLPFLDALASLLTGPDRERIAATLRLFAPTWCLQFPASFRSTDSVERLQRETLGATKERMLREMGDALTSLAKSTPVVLILEDLHWSDPSSIDLLRHLSQRIDQQRLLLIGTFRPEEVELSNHSLKNYKREMESHNQCDEIAPTLLERRDIADYLSNKFSPNNFPGELATLIEQKTEGHPLFTTSLLQFLVERGNIARSDGKWSLSRPLSETDFDVPEGVRSMIRKKLESLSEDDLRTLQYASIEGDEFTSTVLARILGTDEISVEERLNRLERVHSLIKTLDEEELPDGQLAIKYRFAHTLYQNLLYEDLVSKRKIMLHRQVGEELTKHYQDRAPRIAAKLAVHFERGRDLNQAIRYLIHAGDNAYRIYAQSEAEGHYSRALGLVDKLPAVDHAAQYVQLYHKRGLVNIGLIRFDDAIADLNKMLENARALKAPDLECTALNTLSHVLFFSHRLDEMGVCTSESLRVAEGSGNQAMRAETLAMIGRMKVSQGHLGEATIALDESVRVARSLNHNSALIPGLTWRGLVHFFQSEYVIAEERFSEGLVLSSEMRDSFMVLFCLYFLGLTRANLGRISAALADFNEMVEFGQRNGERYQTLKIPNSLGWVHRELEDLEGAFKHDQAGVEISRKHQLLEAEINSIINIGWDCTKGGDPDGAEPAFKKAEALLDQDDWIRWRFNIRLQTGRSRQLLAKGKIDEAEDAARLLLEISAEHKARKYMAIAHELLAEMATIRGDLAAAESELIKAVEILREYPAPLTAWKVYAALGRIRLQTGNKESADDAFSQSAAIVRTITANTEDEHLRSTFLGSQRVREVLERTS
jgi:serine/threonine protein kinase/tetratricopeptide (TPR) repeat protein